MVREECCKKGETEFQKLFWEVDEMFARIY